MKAPIALIGVALILGCASAKPVSKSIRIVESTSFHGLVIDPAGAVVSGIELELRADNKVLSNSKSSRNGEYDFGIVSPDRYKIVIKNQNGIWCKPKVRPGSTPGTRDIELGVCQSVTTVS